MAKKLFITVFAISVFISGGQVLADDLDNQSSLHQKTSINYQKNRSQGQRRNESYRQNNATRLRPKNQKVQKYIRLEDALDDFWGILRFK